MLQEEHSAILLTFIKLLYVIKIFVFVYFWLAILHRFYREGSCSVVECLTWDRGAPGSSLTGVTVLCPWAGHINPSLVLVQPKKTCPFITERLLMGRKESNQTKQTNKIIAFSCEMSMKSFIISGPRGFRSVPYKRLDVRQRTGSWIHTFLQ